MSFDYSSDKERIAKCATTVDFIDKTQIKKIAAFDISYKGRKAVCAVVVVKYPSMEILEKKHIIAEPPIPYVPGLLAFREGPLILQAFYLLDERADVLMIDGQGIAHSDGCGTAAFVGVEASMPTIGVGKDITFGELKDDKIFDGEEFIGMLIKTKQYAKPVVVSPGNKISVETSAEIVSKCTIPPHKLPEPLHIAHRYADKIAKELKDELI